MLTGLLLLPCLGALSILLLPSRQRAWARPLALVAASLTLLLALSLAWGFDPGRSEPQWVFSVSWNERVGTRFALGVDGISLPLVWLGALLSWVAVLASQAIDHHQRLYFALLLLLEAALLGVFLALDWSLFYVFWELTLIPLFFIIDRLGGAGRSRAALNFVLYTLGGSVFMLVALLLLYDASPGHSFAMADMAQGGRSLPLATQMLVFAGLLIGFGVKLPIFPLHGWLPLAHVEAPGPISILLSGILLKMGAYGLLRAMGTLPDAFVALQDLLLLLALLSLVHGSVLAWRQTDLKAAIAYASIAHMGMVLLGIATLGLTGLHGAVLQMVTHGLAAAMLFLAAGLLYQRSHQRDLGHYGSLLADSPRLAGWCTLAFFLAAGLPGSGGFVAELHVLIATWQRWGFWVLVPALALLTGFAVALRVSGRLASRLQPAHRPPLPDLLPGEVAMLALLAALLLGLGLWPGGLHAWAQAPLLQLLPQRP